MKGGTVEQVRDGKAQSLRPPSEPSIAAMIVFATLIGRARPWSQDMRHGLQLGERLRMENPFR